MSLFTGGTGRRVFPLVACMPAPMLVGGRQESADWCQLSALLFVTHSGAWTHNL